MVWVISACAIAALIGASFVAVGKLGGMPEPVHDTYRPTLPANPREPLTERPRFGFVVRGYERHSVDDFVAGALADPPSVAEVDAVRFPVTTPGYEPTQVDDVLDRLREQAREREA